MIKFSISNFERSPLIFLPQHHWAHQMESLQIDLLDYVTMKEMKLVLLNRQLLRFLVNTWLS